MEYVKGSWRDAENSATVGIQSRSRPLSAPDLVELLNQATRTPKVAALIELQEAIDQHMSEAAAKEHRARLIRELREQSPYTQAAIAKRLNIGLRGYQKIEKTGGAKYETLSKLAVLHGVDVDYFYRGENGDQPAPDDASQILEAASRIEQALERNHKTMQALLSRLAEAVPEAAVTDPLADYEQAQADADRLPPAGKRAAGQEQVATPRRRVGD